MDAGSPRPDGPAPSTSPRSASASVPRAAAAQAASAASSAGPDQDARDRSRSPNWRDDPDARWVRILVRIGQLPDEPGDFRDFDADQWSELEQDGRYRYQRVRGVDGGQYLAWRAIPGEGDDVDALKWWAERTLWRIFNSPISRGEWHFENERGEHVPFRTPIFEGFASGEDAYLRPNQ